MSKLLTLLATTLFGFVAYILYAANTAKDNIFFHLVRITPYGDKIGHALLFGLLTLAAITLTRYRTIKLHNLNIPIGTILIIIATLLEECSQLFIQSRTFDLTDILADSVGIGLCTFIAIKTHHKINNH